MRYKWKINGSNLVIHDKESGAIYISEKEKLTELEMHLDKGIETFLIENDVL